MQIASDINNTLRHKLRGKARKNCQCMSAEPSRFIQHVVRSDNEVLLEAVLPGGSITGVFRNEKTRAIAIEGQLNEIEWTIFDNPSSPDLDVLHLLIPDDYDFKHIGISLDASKGRILLSLPIATA